MATLPIPPIKTENTAVYIEHEDWPQIDRRYSCQLQHEPYTSGQVAFPISFEGDRVYPRKETVSAMQGARFDNVGSLLKALAAHGDNARILGWVVKTTTLESQE